MACGDRQVLVKLLAGFKFFFWVIIEFRLSQVAIRFKCVYLLVAVVAFVGCEILTNRILQRVFCMPTIQDISIYTLANVHYPQVCVDDQSKYRVD